jgi:WXG100 family type VII secretion target
MADGVISAHFGSVEQQAQAIVKKAEMLRNDLQEFHNKVQEYVTNVGAGAANDSFGQLQTKWNQRVQELNGTLGQAGQCVQAGNDDLQSTDVALSSLFS